MSSDEAQVQQQMDSLREWLRTMPNIPEIDDHMLRRFLHSCYYDVAATKKCIELFYTIRANCSKIFANRDPMSEETQRVFKYAKGAFLTNGKDNVRIWQLHNPSLSDFNHAEMVKALMMVTDVTFLEEKNLSERDIFIMDAKHISLKLITKINMSILKNTSQYVQEAMPVRLKAMHIINAPSYIDKFFAIMKPLLTKDRINMIHFHKPNSDNIFEHLDRAVVPKDFGGTAPSMDELMVSMVKSIENQREFLTSNEVWRSTNFKKIDQESANTSFKSLAID